MKKYLKSANYDINWVEKNWMGPNPLWLLEDLCEHLDLRPGMKVLDMGCGKGLTSVFLAKEFGVTVFACDLWIGASENLRRFEDAGVADKVFPIHAEAHALPFAEGFFDVAIAVDCYHYFGASESYFPDVFSKLVKSGGQFSIVVPGLTREFEKGYPETLESLWCLRFTAAAGGKSFGRKLGCVKSPRATTSRTPKPYGGFGPIGRKKILIKNSETAEAAEILTRNS